MERGDLEYHFYEGFEDLKKNYAGQIHLSYNDSGTIFNESYKTEKEANRRIGDLRKRGITETYKIFVPGKSLGDIVCEELLSKESA